MEQRTLGVLSGHSTLSPDKNWGKLSTSLSSNLSLTLLSSGGSLSDPDLGPRELRTKSRRG